MIKIFNDLGKTVESEWIKFKQSEDVFAEIATEALLNSDAFTAVEPAEILQWLGTATQLPEQYKNDFGQPPVNVYVGDGFYIQVLFWFDSTTAIHGHSFNGSFGVLSGSSVHSRYSFELTSPISKELMLGNVRFISAEILQRGDVRTIESGDKFVHSLFHLECPSLSLVIRTPGRPGIAFSYVKPYLAWDPFHGDNAAAIRLRMLESLNCGDSSAFWEYSRFLVRRSSPWMLYQVLLLAYSRSGKEAEAWADLLSEAWANHRPTVARAILTSIEDEYCAKRLSALRSATHDPTYRFFLALLMNVPSNAILLNLIEQRFPSSDAQDLIIRWLKEMSETSLLHPKLEPITLQFIKLAMCHSTLEEALVSISGGKQGAWLAAKDELTQLWNTVRTIDYLRPLFSLPGNAISELEVDTALAS